MAITGIREYYSSDEASGNLLGAHASLDLTESGLVGSATGIVSGARDYESGDSDFFYRSSHSTFQFGDNTRGFMAWVRLESKTGSHMSILTKTTDGEGEYFLAYNNSDDRFKFDVFGGSSWGSAGSVTAESLGSPSTATWYLVVAWHDAAANTLNIQVNNGTIDSSSHSAGVHSAAGDFCIGGNTAFGQYFDGLIDEVFHFDGSPSDDDLTWAYNFGNGRTYDEWQDYISGGTAGSSSTFVGTLVSTIKGWFNNFTGWFSN